MNMYTPIGLLILFTQTEATYWEKESIYWNVTNSNGTINIPVMVPGGIYTDLYSAGIIDNILYRFNDVNSRWVAYETWTYIGIFEVCSKALSSEKINLVLEGVDTVAFIELNGSPVGVTDNMFLRYVFDVQSYLKEGENEVKIRFESPVKAAKIRSDKYFTAPACTPAIYNGECHVNQLRKMQASFGWDWGPAFPSVGLWKPAYIQFYRGAIITDILTHITKVNQMWHIKINTYIETDTDKDTWRGQVTASLVVREHQKVSITQELETRINEEGLGRLQLNLSVSTNVVSLWWPNGYGSQPLYNLTVSINSDSLHPEESFYKTIRIGFRTIELVEEDASHVIDKDEPGSEGLTFYFKVNGYPIFMKGSNWIPSNILPELTEDTVTVEGLLLSARSSHMNMLRVWGGGVYESDYFYRRCDELGILIWQDFLFACSMYPVDPKFLLSVAQEIHQNVRRLQYHPSIAVWAGNNENEVALRGNWYNTETMFEKYKEEYVRLYVETIKPIVEDLDPGRRYLVSSPSNGLQSEREGYIAENPYDPHYGDTHYYNYLANNWDANIYPKTRFASEYGFQSLPSIITMRDATNVSKDFSLFSKYSLHRQHSPGGYMWMTNQIKDQMQLEEGDKKYFEKFIFYSQIYQAVAIKTETEFYRQSQTDWYTMGALYWQLNDVWQAPSWSGIEYGLKWKMLHYFSRSFFAPVLVSAKLLPTEKIELYLINDRFIPIANAEIKVDYFFFDNLTPARTETYKASAEPLRAKKQCTIPLWKDLANTPMFLRLTLKSSDLKPIPTNFLFTRPLKDAHNLIRKPTIRMRVTESRKSTPEKPLYIVDLHLNTIILFLWLETPYEGHFKENGFIVTEPFVQVKFKSKVLITPSELQRSITYKYYINQSKR